MQNSIPVVLAPVNIDMYGMYGMYKLLPPFHAIFAYNHYLMQSCLKVVVRIDY